MAGHKISQAKVDALFEDMKRHAPDTKIYYKTEPAPNFKVAVIYAIFNFIGLFSPQTKKDWFEKFANGFGNIILLPDKKTYGDATDYITYMILRHEYVHVLESIKEGVWFYLKYLFLPLPTVLTFRADKEFRGYAQNMIVMFEEFGVIPDTYIEIIADHFSGAMYFFMLPFRGYVIRKLKELRQLIYDGHVSGFNPNISIFRDGIILK